MASKVMVSLKSILSEAQRRGFVAQNAALPTNVKKRDGDEAQVEAGKDFPTREEINLILKSAAGRWRP